MINLSSTKYLAIMQLCNRLPIFKWLLLDIDIRDRKPNSWMYDFVEVSGHILSVFRLEVSVWISYTIGKEVWFFSRFFSSTVYSNWTNETKKRLCEFEEIEISRQTYRGDYEKQEGKFKTFVWISSKNSALDQQIYIQIFWQKLILRVQIRASTEFF